MEYVVCNEFKQKDSIAFLNYICNNSDVISMKITTKLPHEKVLEQEFAKICSIMGITKEEGIENYTNNDFINKIYEKVKDSEGIINKWSNPLEGLEKEFGEKRVKEAKLDCIRMDIENILFCGAGKVIYEEKIERLTNILKEDFIKKESIIRNHEYMEDYDIYYYKMSEKLKEMLIQEVQKVKNIYYIEFPNFPEDFEFYRKGKCWVTITSHEEECYITLENEKEYQELTKLGIELD